MPREDYAFLQVVAQSIADAGAVLVTGPANAKTEVGKHISQHNLALMKIIVGVATVDHASDGQLVAYARRSSRRKIGCCRKRGKPPGTLRVLKAELGARAWRIAASAPAVIKAAQIADASFPDIVELAPTPCASPVRSLVRRVC